MALGVTSETPWCTRKAERAFKRLSFSFARAFLKDSVRFHFVSVRSACFLPRSVRGHGLKAGKPRQSRKAATVACPSLSWFLDWIFSGYRIINAARFRFPFAGISRSFPAHVSSRLPEHTPVLVFRPVHPRREAGFGRPAESRRGLVGARRKTWHPATTAPKFTLFDGHRPTPFPAPVAHGGRTDFALFFYVCAALLVRVVCRWSRCSISRTTRPRRRIRSLKKCCTTTC